MNSTIEQAFASAAYPVSFLYYDGDAATYCIYQSTDIDTVFSADNGLQNYRDYYDVDIYSKGNYFPIIADVKQRMTGAGFYWIPSRSSADMYDRDTGLFHKTLCFAIERSV